jgi:hypothetical protein
MKIAAEVEERQKKGRRKAEEKQKKVPIKSPAIFP